VTPSLRRLLLIALLGAPVAAGAAADATWKSHRNQNCGVELKYPPAYEIDAPGAPDHCALWIRIGIRTPRGLRALFVLDVREMNSVEREHVARSGAAASARDFALHVATVGCSADGPDGSTSCVDGAVRSTFRTAQGFRGFEIHLTEVRETFVPKRTEKRAKGPLLALDLSDDETVRVLLANAEPGRVDALRAILDTVRVWTKPRRLQPRVVELRAFTAAPHALTVRVAPDERYRSSRPPPVPVTSWFLVDPRGRRLGRDLATGAWLAEVPAITYSSAGDSGFTLRESVEGRYELQVSAPLPSVPYQVTVGGPDRAGKPSSARQDGRTAEPGAVDRYEIVYARAATPPVTVTAVRDLSRFTVLLSGRGDVPGELILTDPRGQLTGRDPVGNVEHRTIPRSTYVDEGVGQRVLALDLRQPADGRYTLQATGTAAGAYGLDLRAWDRGGTGAARPELRDVPTAPGVVHLYRLDYAATARVPLTLGGGFAGSGGKTDEVNGFLAYANPASVETRLRAGTTSFPLVVFYGARIQPVTFSALLNGDNISGRFTPEPGGSQIVRLPLAAGLNTLVLSVDGATAGGATATDADRLAFRVE
jgi:hypothetical protein